MKFVLSALFSLGLMAQSTPVTVTFSLPNAVLADVLTWTKTQTSNPSPAATLSGAINAAVAIFTISSAAGYTATDTFSNAGATLLIDSEEILCTTLTGAVYSGCTRAQQQTVAASHSAGATVSQLKYATNASLLKALLIPGVIGALGQLNGAGSYLGTLISTKNAGQAALDAAQGANTIVK